MQKQYNNDIHIFIVMFFFYNYAWRRFLSQNRLVNTYQWWIQEGSRGKSPPPPPRLTRLGRQYKLVTPRRANFLEAKIQRTEEKQRDFDTLMT